MSLRKRIWLEFMLAIVAIVLTVLSIVWPTWWESAFESSPDSGSGTWERLLALMWLAAAVAFGLVGRRDLRRLESSPGQTPQHAPY